MADPIISVENLSKLYRLNHESKRADSFRELLTSTALAPYRKFRQLGGGGGSGGAGDTEDFWALRDVSFEVNRGEVVGIIGRNGAGKSTLLKVLSRIVEPTSGRAVLRGRVASLLEVGTGFHPELTGRENIYMNGSILGMKRREITAKFDEIVAFAEVEKFLDTPVKRYSSGMYVRLAFAVAAHMDPEILIVDEVLAVGDAQFQKKCLGKMQEIAAGRTGRTVLFVSHNMAAVKTLCQKGVLLSRGRVEEVGLIEQVVQRYFTMGSDGGAKVIYPTRPRDAAVWIRKAEIRGGGPDPHMILMGDHFTLRVEFGAEPAVGRPRLGWVLTDSNGTRVMCANNRYQPSVELTAPVRSGEIECELGLIPLMAGRYYFSLYLGNEIVDTHVLIDALVFDVVAHDVWGDGKIPPANVTPLWWPCQFNTTAVEGKVNG